MTILGANTPSWCAPTSRASGSALQIIIEYVRWLGLSATEGEVLSENSTMLAMCRELGFAITGEPNDPDICVLTLPLA